MSHEIPEPYCWDESFKTFYDKIDNEHKILFQGIFNVAAGREDAGTLKNLIDNVEFHFNEEQGLMEKANYSEFPAHKQLHVDFIAKLKGISCPVSDDSVHFAKEWLVNHIKDTDFKYKGKLDTLDELEQLHISNDK